jgi:hypothetical protein
MKQYTKQVLSSDSAGTKEEVAGPLLQWECANLPLCLPGNTVVTKVMCTMHCILTLHCQGYLLPATYVLHTVAPYLDENNQLQPNVSLLFDDD